MSPVLAVSTGLLMAMLIVWWPWACVAAPVALCALLLVCRHPLWMLPVWFISLGIPVQKSLAGLPLTLSDALLVGWWMLLPFLKWPGSERAQPSRWRLPDITRAMLPFLVAAALSQWGSINPSASFKQLLRLVEWFVLLPWVLASLRWDLQTRRFAALVLMVAPCAFALDGVVEYITHGRSVSGMLGIGVPVPEGTQTIRHTFDVSGRAGSTFGGAQGLAMFLAMSGSVAWAHCLRPTASWHRPLALLSLLVSAAGLAVSQSRGGMLGAAVMLTVIALSCHAGLRRGSRWGLLLVALAAWLGLSLWPQWDGSVEGLVPGRPEAVLDRLIIWGKALQVASESPWFGVGLSNFRDAFYGQEPWLHVPLGYASTHAHNTYLEILADTGGVGLACYLLFLFWMGRGLWLRWQARGDTFTLAALGALGAYLVFATVDMLLLQNMHMLLVTLLTLGLNQEDGRRLGMGRESKHHRVPGSVYTTGGRWA